MQKHIEQDRTLSPCVFEGIHSSLNWEDNEIGTLAMKPTLFPSVESFPF